MPFIDNTAPNAIPAGGLPPQGPEPVAPVNNTPFTDLVGTAFDAHTSIGQLANVAGESSKWNHSVDHTPDPHFNPFDSENITGYEDVSHVLGQSRNKAEFDYYKGRIDRERAQDQQLASAGGTGLLAGLAAGLADPINFIPVGEAKAIYQSGNVLRGLREGAVAGAGIGAASEAINQATRLTPTAKDSLESIGGSTILFGSLGAATGAFRDAMKAGEVVIRNKKVSDFDTVAETMAKESAAYADDLGRKDGLSAGAAQTPQTTLEQNALVRASLLPDAITNRIESSIDNSKAAGEDLSLGQRIAGRVNDAMDTTQSLSFQDPTLRLANSDSNIARRTVEQMADSPLLREKNLEGIASPVPVDSILRQHEANLETIAPQVYDMFTMYRKGRAARVGDALVTGVRDLVAGAPDGKLTFKEFREEIGKAMARGDTHAIPEVAQAAKVYRERIFEPLKERAIEQGLLPADVEPKTAASYISRVYNKNKIIAQRPDFENRITQWLKSTNENITERFDNYIKQSEIAKAVVEKHTPALDDARVRMAELRPKEKTMRDQNIALTRETQVLQKQYKAAGENSAKFRERAANLTPAQASAELARNIKDLKRGIGKGNEPQSLTAFVRSERGIKDVNNDFQGRDMGKGVVNNKSGKTLDEMARMAQEYGFFHDHPGDQRIDINTFLDALEGDAQGYAPRIKEADRAKAEYRDYLRQLDEEINKAGGDVHKHSAGQIENILYGKDKGVANTPSTRARLTEAEFHARRHDEIAKKVQKELDKRTARHAEVKTKRAVTKEELNSLRQTADDLERIIKINTGKAERFRKLADDVHYIAGASDGDLELIAREITDGLIHNAPGRVSYEGVPVTRGPLKERTLLIPDQHIEDFLDRDIFRVARHYNHTMSTDLELHKAFGSTTMEKQLQAVGDDYEKLRLDARMKHGVTDEKLKAGDAIPEALQKELKALDKSQKRDMADIEGIRDRLRGTYGLPSNPQSLAWRSFRVVKGINFMRLMGGVTISSFPDLARPLMIHGVMRGFSDGLAPLVKNFSQFKLAASEARLAGTAIDMITNDRALALAGLDDAWMGTTKFERGVTALTDNYKFISFIAPWTDAIKKFSAVISQTRSLEAIETLVKGGDLDGKELARLAQYGIDEPMAQRMWKEVNNHGKKDSGVWWANTGAWLDKEAAQTYRSALQRETDKIVVTPGQDKPLFMSTAQGSTLLQFKTFAFASTQRMLISGLQQRDAAALNGFMLSMALGMVSYWAKTDSAKLSDKPQKWILEGIDRGGALAWFMDVNNTMEKVTGFGLNPMLGLPEQSRYASRDAASAVFGPTYGTVFGTLLPLVSSISRGELTRDDLHKARQLMPYQNLFYIRGILDKVEEATGNSLSLPEKKKK